MTEKTRLFTVTAQIELYNDATLSPGQTYGVSYDPDSRRKAGITDSLTIENTKTGESFEVTGAAFHAIFDSDLISLDNN